MRISNECYRLFLISFTRFWNIHWSIYTPYWLTSEVPQLWLQTDGITGAHFPGTVVSYVFAHLNRERLITLGLRYSLNNQMPFATILRRYFKHDDITAFILQVLYESLVIELPLAVYGCETWSLTDRKEKRLYLRTNCWDVIHTSSACWRQYLNK